MGLWFAPDSWNEFENWQRDAECLLAFFNDLGVEHFKLDGIKAATEVAVRNLKSLFEAVQDGSNGKVVFDLDITAGVRPGYFGAMGVGPLFVENRYTDFYDIIIWRQHEFFDHTATGSCRLFAGLFIVPGCLRRFLARRFYVAKMAD